MSQGVGLSLGLTTLALIAILAPITAGDTVIESQRIELLEAGSFDDPGEWSISTKAAFSDDPADHSVGMVADGE